MGTLKENGDLLGTPKLKKVPMGARGPKWGPTWEQCITILIHDYHLDKVEMIRSDGSHTFVIRY